MKKIIVFLCLCVCLAVSAMATEQEELPCNGGSIITAKDGTKFCKSDKTMNWWTAFAWCESQGKGRKLADFAKACPDASQAPAETEGQCPNLQGKGDVWIWSSLAQGSGSAISVKLSSGTVRSYNRKFGLDYGDYAYALCE